MIKTLKKLQIPRTPLLHKAASGLPLGIEDPLTEMKLN